MIKKNPFRFGGIVSGEYFYNREEELLRLKQTLAGGNNVILYAPRRYGKSSLVKKVLDELSDEGFVTLSLDFMRVYSRETFIKNYAAVIAKSQGASLEKTVKKIAKLISGIVPSVSFDSSGIPSFSISWIEGKDKERTLADVINLPDKFATPQKRWIIAFDEFQEVTKLNGENFEKLLRSCIQNHQNVSYLFFGSKTHLLQELFNNKNRAFYNAGVLMRIGKIDKSKSIEYLKTRFGKHNKVIDKDTSEYLLATVANIPYYIQFIASEIWQALMLENRKKVTKGDIDKAKERILELNTDYYWELTNKQTVYRKKVLYALSQSGTELFAKNTADKYGFGAGSSTQKALETFMDNGLIERINGKYEFADPFFKLFIQKYL